MTAGRGAFDWLEPAVADGGLVLASSRRLARELRRDYDERQLAAGRLAWPTPAIRYWQDWLRELVTEYGDDLPRPVGSATSVLIWEQALEESSREPLLSTAAVVRHARQAWQRLHDWRLPLDDAAALAASRDEHWFLRAARAYAAELDAAGWLDAAMLPAAARSLLAGGRLPLPTQVVQAGFDRLTPALEALFETLRSAGVTVSAAPAPARDGRRRYASFADDDAQWRAAGRWARARLEADPGARIAVVAPDLDSNAPRIARLVREGYAPGWQQAGSDWQGAVNVSYGRALADFPLLAVARQCLRFAAGGLRSAEVGALLLSDFLGNDDRAGRSRLEAQLREIPDRLWRPDELLRALDRPRRPQDGQGIRERLVALANLATQAGEAATPAVWAERMDGALQGVGWPGRRAPDSEEFQLHNRWRELLNEFAALPVPGDRLTLPGAVQRLFRIAADTVYQPEAPDGGLPVLGLLETAGLEFDDLWIGGMDAARWPPAGHPLALVNRQLQREHRMPDATPADTAQFARRVLDRLLASADGITLSWPRRAGDEERVPTPLLDIPDDVAADSDDPGWHARSLLGGATLVRESGDTAPPVLVGEKVRGGAYTVQRMHEEPFAAFAEGRLGIGELLRYEAGLSPRLRGIVVHDALQRLFEDLPSQEELLDWDEDHCRERIEEAAYRALQRVSVHADDVLKRVLSQEKTRVMALLRNFLQTESERAPFRIEALERKSELVHGPLRLDLRVDRVDRLTDGSRLVIDYKTGARKTFMNRETGIPHSLQLCVYARSLDMAIGGLALVYLDSREIAWEGEGGSVDIGKIAADNWHASLEEWLGVVNALLTRFCNGELGVNVEQAADKARGLALLNRVEEMRRDR